MTKNIFGLFFVFSLLASCKKEEKLPTYLYIDKFELTTKDGEGSNSHAITDVWVSINDSIKGIFELPVKFPLLNTGVNNVKLYPGIKANGLKTFSRYYPFYTFFEQDINLQELKVDSISPKIEYFNFTAFRFLDDFESTGLKFENYNRSSALLSIESDPAKLLVDAYNRGALKLEFVTKNEFSTIISSEMSLPQQGSSEIYLELNYACSNIFDVGLFSDQASDSPYLRIVSLKKTFEKGSLPVWKKVYVQLTTAVNSVPDNARFRLLFQHKLGDSESSEEVYLDNIKVVHVK